MEIINKCSDGFLAMYDSYFNLFLKKHLVDTSRCVGTCRKRVSEFI